MLYKDKISSNSETWGEHNWSHGKVGMNLRQTCTKHQADSELFPSRYLQSPHSTNWQQENSKV